MTATPTPLRELIREAIAGTPSLWDRPTMLSDQQFDDIAARVEAALSARDEAGAVEWLEAMRDQRAHLRLALVMMRDFASNLRGLDHDADVTDWPSVIGRFERVFDDMFGWAERNRIIRRLAAVAPAGMDGWQPIETAPKDGTEIDVWCWDNDGSGYRITRTWWCRVDNRWRCYGDERMQWMHQPTHWMPEPAAPTQPATAGKE